MQPIIPNTYKAKILTYYFQKRLNFTQEEAIKYINRLKNQGYIKLTKDTDGDYSATFTKEGIEFLESMNINLEEIAIGKFLDSKGKLAKPPFPLWIVALILVLLFFLYQIYIGVE